MPDTAGKTTTVVIGAGSAGGIIAARLSEDPDQRVILVEAGPDYPNLDALPASLRDAFNPQLSGPHDWGMEAYFTEPPESREPGPYPRGRVVGGSSAVNGTVGVRGQTADFERWAERGNPSWSWEKVLPSFIAIEDDLNFGDQPGHSDKGPVQIFRFTEDEWPLSLRLMKEDLLTRGVPSCPDINEPDATGVGPLPRNQTGELRGSTLVNYLQEARKRANLQIRALTLVVRVLVEDGRALGVEVEPAGGGQREVIHADRVVLSAGAVCSPQILMLSGIGPRSELEKFGIPVSCELNGVGRNLQDHPGLALTVTTRQADPAHHGFRLYARLTSSAGERNDIWYCSGQTAISALNWEVETDAEDVLYLSSMHGKPKSRGWISLSSADYRVQPEIHVNFLADESDLQVIKEGYRNLVEMITKGSLSTVLSDVIFPGPATYGDDLLAWLDTPEADTWFRTDGLMVSYHPVGTCRMGPDSDPSSVVSDRLQVHGIEGLYVADASIMPEITNGMVNLSVYMIGHHFVSLLNGEA